MKYEMIFGDDDFDKQNNDMAEVKLWHDCFGPKFVSLEELHCMNSGGGLPRGTVVLAMRRIIKTPVWTNEDQKAGRLPNIGDKHRFDGLDGDFICRFIDSDGDIWSSGDDGQMYSSGDYEAIPIETPAEKAQREEDEFISSMMAKGVVYMSDYIEGLRAAYRKLKGGE